MARLKLGIFIPASPQRVREVAADLPRQCGWMADHHRLRVTSERKEGVGAPVEASDRLFGLPLVPDVMEVTAWEPARDPAVAHRGRLTSSGRFRRKRPWTAPSPSGRRSSARRWASWETWPSPSWWGRTCGGSSCGRWRTCRGWRKTAGGPCT